MSTNELPEFVVNVSRLPTLGMIIKLDAKENEMISLASHMGLEGLSQFRGKLKFRPWARDGVQVEGELDASLETQCPVSMKSVPQQINSEFHAKFAPSTSKLAKPRLNDDGEMLLDFESDDIPDIYEGEELDAWKIAIEYLLLEIDHFARAPGAEFEQISVETEMVANKQSPFAALKSLKSK